MQVSVMRVAGTDNKNEGSGSGRKDLDGQLTDADNAAGTAIGQG